MYYIFILSYNTGFQILFVICSYLYVLIQMISMVLSRYKVLKYCIDKKQKQKQNTSLSTFSNTPCSYCNPILPSLMSLIELCLAKSYLKVLTIHKQECDLILKWDLCRCNQFKVTLSECFQIQCDSCPQKKKRKCEYRHTERRWLQEDRSRDQSNASIAEECPSLLANTRSYNRQGNFSAAGFRKSIALLILVFTVLDSRTLGQ